MVSEKLATDFKNFLYNCVPGDFKLETQTTGWILYVRDQMPLIKKEGNLVTFRDQIHEISKRWKMLSEDDIFLWKQRAKSESKKRATEKKIEWENSRELRRA
jgi:hypothetical protein